MAKCWENDEIGNFIFCSPQKAIKLKLKITPGYVLIKCVNIKGFRIIADTFTFFKLANL